MLSFNSDEANEFEDGEDGDEIKDTKIEKKTTKQKSEYKLSISEDGDSNDFLSSGINNKIQQIISRNINNIFFRDFGVLLFIEWYILIRIIIH